MDKAVRRLGAKRRQTRGSETRHIDVRVILYTQYCIFKISFKDLYPILDQMIFKAICDTDVANVVNMCIFSSMVAFAICRMNLTHFSSVFKTEDMRALRFALADWTAAYLLPSPLRETVESLLRLECILVDFWPVPTRLFLLTAPFVAMGVACLLEPEGGV